MKTEYVLSKIKSRKNPYESKLKKPVATQFDSDTLGIWTLLIFTTILLSSCATPARINCEKAKYAHIGMTQAEIIDLLGEPYFVSLSRDITIFRWQDDEQFSLAKNTLKVTINPATKIVKKIEGSCAQ